MTGLGAVTADAAYGIVAAFGLGAATTILVAESVWFRLIGGVFLVVLGIRIILSRADSSVFDEAQEKGSLRLAAFGAFSSTVVLTLANRATILSFAAIFAALGLAEANRQLAAGSRQRHGRRCVPGLLAMVDNSEQQRFASPRHCRRAESTLDKSDFWGSDRRLRFMDNDQTALTRSSELSNPLRYLSSRDQPLGIA